MSTHHKPAQMQVQANLAQLGILGRLTLIALIAKFAPTSSQYAGDADYKKATDKLVAHGPTLTSAHDAAEAAKKAAQVAITARDGEVAATDGDFNVWRALAEVIFKTEADFQNNGVNQRAKKPQAELVPPTTITVTAYKKTKGSIFSHAQRVVGLTRYICAISVDPVTPTSWQVLNGSQARRVISGLESGKGYWIKYCTERGSNRSAWSDPVYCVAS
jgi:hypothetical protein